MQPLPKNNAYKYFYVTLGVHMYPVSTSTSTSPLADIIVRPYLQFQNSLACLNFDLWRFYSYTVTVTVTVVVAVTAAFIVRLLQLARWRILQSVRGVC